MPTAVTFPPQQLLKPRLGWEILPFLTAGVSDECPGRTGSQQPEWPLRVSILVTVRESRHHCAMHRPASSVPVGVSLSL